MLKTCIPCFCYTDSIPADLKDPFYTDQYDQEHLKPPVASLLLSADLYCRAGSLILKSDTAKPLLGHDAVIQALAQRGLYVTDQERLVTERDLRKRPLQMVRSCGLITYQAPKCNQTRYISQSSFKYERNLTSVTCYATIIVFSRSETSLVYGMSFLISGCHPGISFVCLVVYNNVTL